MVNSAKATLIVIRIDSRSDLGLDTPSPQRSSTANLKLQILDWILHVLGTGHPPSTAGHRNQLWLTASLGQLDSITNYLLK